MTKSGADEVKNWGLIFKIDKLWVFFVNDRAWNLKQAKDRKEHGDWHVKRANEALRRGDKTAYNDHMSRSKPYYKEAEAYMASARKSTK